MIIAGDNRFKFCRDFERCSMYGNVSLLPQQYVPARHSAGPRNSDRVKRGSRQPFTVILNQIRKYGMSREIFWLKVNGIWVNSVTFHDL